MRLEVKRYSLQIVPEDDRDTAYLEEVLGLRRKGDAVHLRRVSPIGIDTAWAYAEARKEDTKQDKPETK